MLRWYEVFPVMELSLPASPADHSAALIVDVGGSDGHDLLGFSNRYPEIPGRLILEALPESIESISDPFKGIEIIRYNFFTPQPVKGRESIYGENRSVADLKRRCESVLLWWCLPCLV